MANPREKKQADSPEFVRKNERRSSEDYERRGFENKNLWPNVGEEEGNEAKAQVRGAGEVGKRDQGIRKGEEDHALEPELIDYGASGGEIAEHQEKIIDKHSEGGKPFSHRSASKEAYALAPVSRSVKKSLGGADGPRGDRGRPRKN